MQVLEIQKAVEREPFRPFSVRLNNGARYDFQTRKDLGASKDFEMLFHFADDGVNTRIDSDSIVEIIEAK